MTPRKPVFIVRFSAVRPAGPFASFAPLLPSTQAAAQMPAMQTSATPYTSMLTANTSYALAQAGSMEGVFNLLGTAASDVSSAVRTVNLAAVMQLRQVETASFTAETTASVKLDLPRKATSSNDAVFGSVTIPFKRLAAVKRFAPSLAEMASGVVITCGAKGCTDAADVIKAAIAKTGQASIRDKLNAVNVAVNRAIRYRRGMDTYQAADHWAAPSETLTRQQGDCEDFAILKMAALRAEGVDMKDMSIVVLFDQKRHFYHAVLSVAVDGNYFILDNMRDQVLPDSRLPDYQSLFSIADGKGYLHGLRAGNKQVASRMPLEKVAPGEGAAY
ncbi:transglutaminase-like cysteine peptidase [Rhizobium mongolense]|uniref:transglutaminase-like cysteine peptidase n=1 Tax=Rhizobium mongolense TaxID=57676 RepID=UPI0034A2B87D